MDLIKDFDSKPDEDSIILICVMRDEAIFLSAFLRHYTGLGVSHFIFIDNGSVDESLDILQEQQGMQIQVWVTQDSYADSDYGTEWLNNLLAGQCKEQWCLTVDVDEFIVLNGKRLRDLRLELEQSAQTVAQFVLIDFYPRRFSVDSAKELRHEDLFLESGYFDRVQSGDYYYFDRAPDHSFVIKGGVRQRVYKGTLANNHSVCLNKKSFFKYDFYNTHLVSAGMHWILPRDFEDWSYENWEFSNQFISYQNDLHVIAHFKFARHDIYRHFNTRIERNQDWNDSEEFRTYVNSRKASFYNESDSRAFSTVQNLYENTVVALLEMHNPKQ